MPSERAATGQIAEATGESLRGAMDRQGSGSADWLSVDDALKRVGLGQVGQPRFERLTPLDASNLRVEDHGVPMHVAALAIVEGDGLREESGRLDLDRIRAHVQQRTHLSPRLRQRLRPAPFAAGPPVWVDDPDFDIARHVRFHDLGYPADEGTMLAVCSQLNAPPLNRSRPLWEMWVLTGRRDGNLALLIRLHHVVADGIAALDLLGVLFDLTAVQPSGRASGQGPAPTPAVRELYGEHIRRQGSALSRAVSSLGRPGVLGRRLWSVALQLRQLGQEGFAPASSLNEPVGTRRRLILVRADLAGARRTAHADGAKINDVVLAAMAGGTRALLESRGELAPDLVLRASVAASLRTARDEVASGNRVGVRLAPLPVFEPDAVRRLRYIAAVTGPARGKPAYQPGGRFLQGAMAATMFRQRLVNLLLSNLSGPAKAVHFAGAEVLEMFQVGLVQGNVALSVGVLSYAGQLNFDIVADPDVIPDLDVFAEGLSVALAELGALSPQRDGGFG
jgi:diacylglycerol O-acyltransferase